MTETLTDFLLARIAANEAFARKRQAEWEAADVGERMFRMSPESPRRMLAECEAKRRIVEQADAEVGSTAADEWLLPLLALPYADHRDYRDEWKP